MLQQLAAFIPLPIFGALLVAGAGVQHQQLVELQKN